MSNTAKENMPDETDYEDHDEDLIGEFENKEYFQFYDEDENDNNKMKLLKRRRRRKNSNNHKN